MKKKIQLVLLSILCMLPWMGSHAQSMYGDAVKADVKMKYVYSLDEALQLAKKEKKPIFCNCFEDWAMPCHGMNKKVFSNQEFADWMDKHFVNLFMDMSTEEGKKFRETYQIKFMAHYVVLDREGNLIHRIVGGAELPTFQEKVACALSPKTSLAGMSRTYEKEKKHDKEFLLRYADVLRTANEGEKYKQVADEYFQMLKPQEWSEVKNWTIFSERVRGNDTIALDYLISHKADFVESVSLEDVDNTIAQVYQMDLLFAATGGKPIPVERLVAIEKLLEKAGVPENHDVFALCHIASLREQGDLLPLLDTVATRVPLMDSRVSRMIDKSLLSLIDKGKIEREKILAYLNGRIAQVDKNTAAEYKSAMLEAGVEGGIVFEELSLEEALKKAAEEGKYVFLDCYTSWCGPCKVMSKQVFVRKAVGDLFNPTCINIKIDMEKGEGPEIAKRYGVQAYPTMFVLNSDGSVKYRLQGGMEAGHFLVKARNALDPTISYTELKGYGSLSACPLEKQADYIIALCDGGELRDATKEIASYLKDVEGRTALYPTVWKLCNHFSDRYTDPVFQFVVSHWADFSFVPKTELELKIERLIFPQYIEYLAGKMSPADFVGLKNLVEQADFRKDYSLVYLDRIVAAYDQKDWEGLMACYENEIARLQDAKVRLNLDVLLHYFAAQAPASVKDQMVAYVQKCIATADSKALNGYNNLLGELKR